jgi:hypothetical protein
MNLQSFVATTAAVSLSLAAAGAGALSLRERPAVAPSAVVASAAPAPPAEAPPPSPQAPPPQALSPQAASPQVWAPARRQLAQAAPHRHPAHEHAHARSVRAAGPSDEPRQVVVLPPGYYPAYAWRSSQGYYRAW